MSEPTVSQAVLITGCSSGIGRATAERLARTGRPVYATARDESAIEDLRAAGCRTLSLDVTDDASMQAAVKAVEDEHGAVGALVNNAGYSQSGAIEEVPLEDVRRQFETNVFGLVRLCQLVLPGMREQDRGRIVNVSSMGANFTFPGGGFYHATKYAVEAISDALRFEVKGFGVEVVLVQPGIIRTGFAEAATTAMGQAAPAGAAAAGGPGVYAEFDAAVAKATRDVYEKGPVSKLGGGSDSVAKVIERAITADRPRIRYRVTPSAHLLVTQRALMPDAVWDRFLATQFPRPGRGWGERRRSRSKSATT